MSKKKVKIDDVRVGMYVQLPVNWLSHDFMKSEFMITNEATLQQLKKQNFSEVIIDFDKSKRPSETRKEKRQPDVVDDISRPAAQAKKVWESHYVDTSTVMNFVDDKKLEPQKKAEKTYTASLDLMEHLLAFPNPQNIQMTKQAIYQISEMALNEASTANHLLHLTSHDYRTYSHSVNVGFYGTILAKEMYKNSNAHDLHELSAGFFLHDIGKTMIESEILNKPGKLNDIERQHIKTHPYMGYKLLLDANAIREESKIIVLHHHEHYDGTGYPNRLKAAEIHEYARICAIADVYDALTTERSYKHAIPSFDALKLMKNEMLLNFDAEIFRRFVQLFVG